MRALAPVLLWLATACGGGQANPSSTSEPFRVQKAQFFEGALPGSPPDNTTYEPGDPPRVVDMMVTGTNVVAGSGSKKLPGHTSPNGYSVGLAPEHGGSGWWMIGTGDEDTTQGTPRLSFTAIADFAAELAPGRFPILLVALDHDGNAGTQFREPLCMTSTGPTADSACNPDKPLPAAAISLSWDTNVDLDLVVQTPSGKLVSPKHPALYPSKATDSVDPSLLPHIDRDSNANCVLDGIRTENMIWPTLTEDQGETELPEEGLYYVYVNLFDPCGQQAARFHVKITTAVPDASGAAGGGNTQPTVEHQWLDQAGELIAIQAEPTDAKGLFVAEFAFP
jgi:hypothetical protein